MQTRFKLLKILVDGNFYSGDELGVMLGVKRSAIWRHIQTLRGYGLDIYAVTGRGYRLRKSIELLSDLAISAALPEAVREQVASIEVHHVLDSTNSHLMQSAALALPAGSICFAEYQSAGRGRQGRQWVSPYGSNLCFSLLWYFDCGPDALSGLSLAVAVGLARGLAALGLPQPGLKWPNDLYIDGRKLAGILLEMSGESSGGSRVVVGVGVNLDMSSDAGKGIDQPWIALNDLLPTPVSRNAAAGSIVGTIVEALVQFSVEGLAPFLPQWQQWDVTFDQRVTLQQAQGLVEGRARGVDASGALLIERDGAISRYMSGDVSLLRTVPASM